MLPSGAKRISGAATCALDELPEPCRDSITPFARSRASASRTTGRDARNRAQSAASVGSFEPCGSSPKTMSREISAYRRSLSGRRSRSSPGFLRLREPTAPALRPLAS